jgi:hypothetical protein
MRLKSRIVPACVVCPLLEARMESEILARIVLVW